MFGMNTLWGGNFREIYSVAYIFIILNMKREAALIFELSHINTLHLFKGNGCLFRSDLDI